MCENVGPIWVIGSVRVCVCVFVCVCVNIGLVWVNWSVCKCWGDVVNGSERACLCCVCVCV